MPAVQAATTTALPSNTFVYNQGGTAMTLTANSNGAFPSIDGYSPSLGDWLLIKNEANTVHNCVYELTTLGDGSTPWVLEYGGPAFGAYNDVIGIVNGDTNGGTAWTVIESDPVLGTDNITYEQVGATTDAQLAFSDITTNNASTSKHGFLKKLDSNAAHFMDGTGNWSTPSGSTPPAPTFQYLTSGSGSTYTTPASCQAIRVKAWGGGGGGGAQTTNNGSAGGDTIFNSVHAVGGSGGSHGGNLIAPGGAGGSSGSGTATKRWTGNAGHGSSNGGNPYNPGACGGGTALGGGGLGGSGAGGSGGTNTGAGGAGGAASASGGGAGGGGGAGEYFELYISSPSSTYTYTIGSGGSGGSAGTTAGGSGGSGMIIVEEFY